MEEEGKRMTEKILNLTLKIIYLLTGEDHVVVKKMTEEGETLIKNPAPIMGSTSHSLIHDRSQYQKILELSKEITELLTGEVPVRYQDITVHFSMEEWEYVEGHKDQYEDIIMENVLNLTSPDKSSEEEMPERFPGLLVSISCPEEDCDIPEADQAINLDDVKVEVITDESETQVDFIPLCKKMDASTDGSSKRSPLSRSSSPMHFQNSTEEKQNVQQDYQIKQLSDIKDEVLTQEEEPCLNVTKEEEEEIPADIHSVPVNIKRTINRECIRGCGAATGRKGRALSPPVKHPKETPFSEPYKQQGILHHIVRPSTTGQIVSQEHFFSLPSSQSSAESADLAVEGHGHLDSISVPCKLAKLSEPQQSLLLFDGSAGWGSVAHPPGLAAEVKVTECTDAQQQVPSAVAFLNVQTGNESRGEEWVEDNVLDFTWTEGCYSDMPSLDEEVVVTLPQQHSKRSSRMEKDSEQPLASTSAATAHHADELSTSKPTQKSSLTWHFFRQCPDDKRRVICKLCHQRLKRGINIMNLSTTCMKRHMQSKHELQWSTHLKNQKRSEPPPAPSSAACSASSPQSRGPPAFPQRQDVTARPPPPASPSNSTLLHGNVQLTIPQTLVRNRKYPPTHPRAMLLNYTISKLLVLEMLPFQLVETDSFKNLMAVAVPRYIVPSRYYFSRRAIPALHTHVVDQMRCALHNAISGKIHITTDTWASNHGQGRYISLTAHWINLVAAEPKGESVLGHVLQPPRIAGRFSVKVSSSSYSATASPSHNVTCTSNFTTTRGKRQQAVLKLICLGDKSRTTQELWTGIKQQIDDWLVPLNLKPGLVVCDNGRNLVAALDLGSLLHIPCMTHVLNLVVQRFLKNYPGMSNLLVKVRAVCAHFQHSHPAAARLSALQSHFGLPVHSLICDVPTRWISTLHMLERLCEQQQAIVDLQLQQAWKNCSLDQHPFTANEWASMRDLCTVLHCFEDCTNMVSAEDVIISVTIPLVCLLEKTLQAMMDDMLAQEEEEEQEQKPLTPISGLSSTHGSEGGFLYQQQPGTQVSSQGTVLEDVNEEDEEEPCSQQGGTQKSSPASLEHGWGDTEDTDITPPTEDSLLPPGSLAHMSQYMLLCLHNDCRVAQILTSNYYWVATLLDPRYKDHVPLLLSSLERDSKMREYKRTLVDALLTAFPPDTGGSVKAKGRGRGVRCQRNWGTRRVSMDTFWKRFVSRPPCDMASISKRQRFHHMVEEYMSTHLHEVTDGSDPFTFWVSKLDTWPELALYALEVLACPAASVLTERVFSTAGGVITDRSIGLGTANVNKLMFLKMNHSWITQDFSLPIDH
ncbi:zinc finger BED domain-containing protein 6-like isoform 2-T2 [Anomaloglossus baeobatrachus]|uniref:zinc finger BED domain-containing protein 6-like isoform X2 n=1 Tax=Anomaloglossus baeobatrachus TaxID=238106 RepID=UPI003F502105